MLKIENSFKPADMNDLNKLALAMTNSDEFVEHSPLILGALPVLNEDAEADSIIPSGYVYLGQFIAHDISFDSMSNRDEPSHQPLGAIPLEGIRNKRNPVFDLETIYGHAKPNPENKEETPRKDLMQPNSRTLLKLGPTFPNAGDSSTAKFSLQNDLPRELNSPKAQIVDPRNDENLILAQTQVAFIKFHNAIVHKKLNDSDTCLSFRKARKIAIRHFQQIILKDFLPRIVQETILEEIKAEVLAGKSKFYHPTPDDIYIPIEFSVAACRIGHTMIRNDYNLNIKHSKANGNIVPVSKFFHFTGKGGEIKGSTDNKLRSTWIINWNWFYDFSEPGEDPDPSLNFSKALDTKFSSALNELIPLVPGNMVNSLSGLDLYRGVALGLPSGQDVAAIMTTKDKTLTAEEIESTFGEKLPAVQRELFKKDTPLIYYLFAEAEIQTQGQQLGEVGSRIVAEVFLNLLKLSPYSILQKGKDLESDKDFLGNDYGGKFGMTELLRFINDNKKGSFDEINPIKEIT